MISCLTEARFQKTQASLLLGGLLMWLFTSVERTHWRFELAWGPLLPGKAINTTLRIYRKGISAVFADLLAQFPGVLVGPLIESHIVGLPHLSQNMKTNEFQTLF